MKGAVEQVLARFQARFQARPVYFDRFPAESRALRRSGCIPYRSARVAAEGETVGWFGQLHPREAAARKLKEPVLVGEIYLDRLYKLPLRKPVAREISRFQPVRRDFSLILSDENITWDSESTRRCLVCRFLSWSSGGRAKYCASARWRGWVRASILCCWARRSRRTTAPCARRNCKAFRRGWWRLLAKWERGCGVDNCSTAMKWR